MVTLLRLEEGADKQFIRKGSALIRRYTGEDPAKMSKEQWAARLNEATWVQDHETAKITNRLSTQLAKVILQAMGYKIPEET